MKQSKLRRKRVFRYAILYFVMLIVFLGLIIAPNFAGSAIPKSLTDMLNANDMRLVQPANQDKKDNTRGETPTGRRAADYSGVGTKITIGTPTETSTSQKIRLF
jgi:1,3-beta-glucan synthase